MTSHRRTLALFDLDHTLLDGDSDVLWCDFLVREGVLDASRFSERNAEMAARYRAGTVGTREFSEFYIDTLSGRSPAQWLPLRERYFREEIAPRISSAARDLAARERERCDLVVLTTATNRFLVEPTVAHLGIEHLIATEPELIDGRFSGRAQGTLNMREGKLERLGQWLAARGLHREDLTVTAYSDSMNDLPLLAAADHPVAVHPDAGLAAWAAQHGHPVLRLH